MLALLWNLSAAIRGYLRFYMPTNRALDWLRTPRGLKWAVPVAVVVAPAYLYAMSVAAVIAPARPRVAERPRDPVLLERDEVRLDGACSARS